MKIKRYYFNFTSHCLYSLYNSILKRKKNFYSRILVSDFVIRMLSLVPFSYNDLWTNLLSLIWTKRKWQICHTYLFLTINMTRRRMRMKTRIPALIPAIFTTRSVCLAGSGITSGSSVAAAGRNSIKSYLNYSNHRSHPKGLCNWSLM